MKKILYTMLVALAATFSFTSCEDVPAPYDIPAGGNGGGNTELTGDGTEANPYTVTDIKTGVSTTGNVFVKAYIVGYVPDKSIDEAVFSADGCQAQSNVIIAASADETDVNNVMPVQLPVGAVRDGINLVANPTNIKQEVVLCGSVEAYFGKTGLKSVVWAKIGDKELGTKPGSTTPVVGDPKGKGTKDDPFNVAAANKYINDGGDATVEVYVKGKVSEVKEYRDTYGSISYYISDDGTTAGQFYVYGGNNLGNTKFTSVDDLKVGDEVIICGKLKNYNGTNEFDSRNYLYSLNGKTEGGSTGGDQPTVKPTEGGMGVAELINGKTSSADLPTNAYGSQRVDDESTWYTWTYGGTAYTGVRICKSSEANGSNIQVQGSSSDASKQGFFFNSTAFGSDIKTITIVVRSANTNATPTTFSVYGGAAAHPTDTKVEGGTPATAADGNYNVFTITYTFPAGCRYFTVWNNAQGALYIDKMSVELN